jgi:hypothetical protein
MGIGSRICESMRYINVDCMTDPPSNALNENYGTADDLKALSSALHERNMYLMVDVVANHMVRWSQNANLIDYCILTCIGMKGLRRRRQQRRLQQIQPLQRREILPLLLSRLRLQ